MKNLFLTAAISFSICSFAQEIKVHEGKESFASGSHNALSINIYETDKANVEKEWKRLLKDFHPEKTNDSKGEYFFDNTTFKSLGNNPIDVYSKVVDKGDKSVQLIVCFDLGGAFLNSSEHKDKYDYFKKLMHDFATNTTKEAINEALKEATKTFDHIVDKEHDLEKDNKNLDEDIVNYNEKITKAKQHIEKNKQEIEVKKKEMEAQQKVVDGIKTKLHKVI